MPEFLGRKHRAAANLQLTVPMGKQVVVQQADPRRKGGVGILLLRASYRRFNTEQAKE
jgi:hypothetical protein